MLLLLFVSIVFLLIESCCVMFFFFSSRRRHTRCALVLEFRRVLFRSEENAEFFTLTYETPVAVSHNLAFNRVAPLLWLRAGARGSRIDKLPVDSWAEIGRASCRERVCQYV